MRIVMVTDDGPAIDRRILLEADTLMAAGHEVILLARQVESVPPAEHIGRLKVERLQIGAPLAADWQTREALMMLLPDWVRRIAGKVGRVAWLGLGTARFASSYLKGYDAYLNWNKHQRARLLASPDLPLKQRLRLRAGGVARVIQQAGLRVIGGAAYAATAPLRHLRRQTDLGSFVANAWDRAVQHRIMYYDPDVIHVHDLPQLYGGVLAKRALKVPLVYDTHENYSVIGTLTKAEQAFMRERETKLLHECDIIITVNKAHAAAMKEQYPPHRFDVIHNATSPPDGFKRGRHCDSIRRALGLAASVRILLYQGWFSEHGRGLLELIRAMPLVRPDVHLVMMGYGDFERFGHFVREAGCANRVHLMQPVPWQELVHWSASADVGIIPYQEVDKNHTTCSPNKLFEFIVAGLPMLANDLVFLRYAIQDHGFGLVRRMTTPEEMAAAINEIFDPATDTIAQARGRLLADAVNWEWAVEAKKLLLYYDRIPPPRAVTLPRIIRRTRLPDLAELVPNYEEQLRRAMAGVDPAPDHPGPINDIVQGISPGRR